MAPGRGGVPVAGTSRSNRQGQHRRRAGAPVASPAAEPEAWDLRRLGLSAAAWVVVTVLAAAAVSYGFGPLFQGRDQRALMAEYKAMLYDASVTVTGPGSQVASPLPPTPGTPVGILEVGPCTSKRSWSKGSRGPDREGARPCPGHGRLGGSRQPVVVARRATWASLLATSAH